MILRTTRILAAAALALGIFTAGAVLTHPASAQAEDQVRGERGSRGNIVFVERRLARLMENLEHDQRDYGGHRVRAIALLHQADDQLHQAIVVDRNSPH